MAIPDNVIAFSKAVRDAGGRAIPHGGGVRDPLLTPPQETKDWDIEVYGISPNALRDIVARFGEVNVVGEAFAVYKVGHGLDVSLPRREKKTGSGHRGFVVEGDPSMSFAEACSRRDFTINAILQDPLTGEIIDPFDGRSDIKNRILRMVSRETFGEDSLRVMRTAQFSARFNFSVEAQTAEICRSIELTDLPRERVWAEFEKLLLKATEPSIGLKLLYDWGVIGQLFPELHPMKTIL